MPKSSGSELPDDLLHRLGGEFAEQYSNHVILIHTVDTDGWAHPAILSYFEVVARDRHNLRMATYNTSRTTENIRRTGKVTLSIFDDRVACYIKGTASEIDRDMRSAPYNCKLNVVVDQVLVDYADPVLEPGAYITGGITYAGANTAAERSRHAKILKELLE